MEMIGEISAMSDRLESMVERLSLWAENSLLVVYFFSSHYAYVVFVCIFVWPKFDHVTNRPTNQKPLSYVLCN